MSATQREQLLYYAAYASLHLRLTALHPMAGEQIWHKEIAIRPFSSYPNRVTELHLVDDVLYVGNWRDGSVVAVDSKTRRVLWQYEGDEQNGFIYEHEMAICGDIIGLPGYHTLRVLQATTGQLLWTNEDEYDFWQIKATRKAIYAITRERKPLDFPPSPSCVLAFDLQAGTVLWKKTYPALRLDKLFVSATDKKVYIVSHAIGSPSQVLHTLHSENGNEIWTKSLVLASIPSGLQIDDVFYLTVGPHLLALDARTGNQRWDHEHHPIQDHKPDRSISLLASRDPLFTAQESVDEVHEEYDDCLYRLSAIDRATGKALWCVRQGGDEAVTSAKQEVIFFSMRQFRWREDFTLFAVSKEDGRELWSAFRDDKHFQAMACT